LKSDRTLARSLKSAGVKPEEGLARALARATERGTLLCLSVSSKKDPVGDTYYFMNSQAGRRALAQMERESPPADRARRPDPTDAAERPNVFELYEKSFGLLLTPVIADELKEAEREYPVEWIADALKEAALQGKRNWKYARRILERWKTEGRVDSKKGKPWYGDEYGKYIKR
jgi:DnaD/phage-associated family protein